MTNNNIVLDTEPIDMDVPKDENGPTRKMGIVTLNGLSNYYQKTFPNDINVELYCRLSFCSLISV